MTLVIGKILSANDTAETGAHQDGVHVSKDPDIIRFFPPLDETKDNPSIPVTFADNAGADWDLRFKYYNNFKSGGTINEYRLTRIIRFLRAHDAHAGDVLLLSREEDGSYGISLESLHRAQGVRQDEGWSIIERAEVSSYEAYLEGLPEGARRRVTVNRFERSHANRESCLAVHGTDCAVCGLSLGDTYGALGEGFIEVHHLVPLASMSAEYVVDPATDLVPLCPNCHAMIHRRNPPLSVAELRERLVDQELH